MQLVLILLVLTFSSIANAQVVVDCTDWQLVKKVDESGQNVEVFNRTCTETQNWVEEKTFAEIEKSKKDVEEELSKKEIEHQKVVDEFNIMKNLKSKK